jgi:hypothetical protein
MVVKLAWRSNGARKLELREEHPGLPITEVNMRPLSRLFQDRSFLAAI